MWLQVNGDYGKFCIENDPIKMGRGELQKITFSAVRNMQEAQALVMEVVDLQHDCQSNDTERNDAENIMTVVHMVIGSCRVQHYMFFSEAFSQLPYSIMNYNLGHIFSIERRIEMDASMMFLKVTNWDALLTWIESSDVVGCKLNAYRHACQRAHDSQIPFVKTWTKAVKNDDDYQKYVKDLDTYAHMIARITMNGFVQIHLMWNKKKGAKLQTESEQEIKNSGSNRCSSQNPCMGGIFWTPEVEVMVKMRMGLIMHVIEILC